MKLFKRKQKKEVVEQPPDVIVEYRIREVKYEDGRTEFFAEGMYNYNQKRDDNDKWKWSNIGDSYYIAFDKGYATMKEAEDRIEKKKQFFKNPSGIVEEKIYTK